MPTPTVITDLSTTAASNYPAGSDSPNVLDDVQRAHAAFIAQLRDDPTANIAAPVPVADGGTGAATAGAALTALGAAPIASPIFTGTPVVPTGTTGVTQAAADSSTKLATTAFVQQEVPAASTTAAGKAELATSAETQTGTDTARVVTPDGLGDTVLGMGQTYQDMTASRAMATLYTNSTGRPIIVDVRCNQGTQCNYTLSIAGSAVSIVKHLASDTVTRCAYGIVPNGSTYQITLSAGTATNIAWWELR